MGSPKTEKGRNWFSDETQHKVTLTGGFWLAKTPVTQKQWKSVMGNNPSRFKGETLPVESVSWNKAQQFCQKTGLQLPTEAQWEYACRAGSSGSHSGTGRLDEMGWHCGNSEGQTHPVAQKKANAWGFYDMHGNVEEWCADWFGGYPRNRVTDPTGPASGKRRVLRGGGCWNLQPDCRSAARNGNYPEFHGNTGLRPLALPD